ncbi:MAG: DsbA family protein [Candidatus Diapherotrites archaeon]
MKPVSSPKPCLRVRAYFDFMDPWSYLARVRFVKAIHAKKIPTEIEWVPYQLYRGNIDHFVERKTIYGHETLQKVYADLHHLGVKENIIIRHPRYESSSLRALTGYFYAMQRGKGDAYMDLLYEQVFEQVNDISSLALLSRIAIKLGFNVQEFIAFIEHSSHQNRVHHLTQDAQEKGIAGLPTYIVNGIPVVGALTTPEWKEWLDQFTQHSTPLSKAIPLAQQKKKKTKSKPSSNQKRKRGKRKKGISLPRKR